MTFTMKNISVSKKYHATQNSCINNVSIKEYLSYCPCYALHFICYCYLTICSSGNGCFICINWCLYKEN